MRARALATAALAAMSFAASALAHDDKRTDKCGCHHQYGLRHCHPKKKTEACVAPAEDKEKPKAKATTPKPKAAEPRRTETAL